MHSEYCRKLDEYFSKSEIFSSHAVSSAFSLLINARHGCFAVGGCVRDALLGRPCHDVDLCTDATPEEIQKLLADRVLAQLYIVPTGIKHGTVTLVSKKDGSSAEITTYRTDGKSSDHRHPDEVAYAKTLEEDLGRRDFTANALAYCPYALMVTSEASDKGIPANEEFSDSGRSQKIVKRSDYGLPNLYCLDKAHISDVENGIVRCVGDPEERFEEDALRMLRAVRFQAQLSFFIDGKTLNAIKEKKSLIKFVSAERVKSELDKILMSDHPGYLVELIETGLSEELFSLKKMPYYEMNVGRDILAEMLGCRQNNPYHHTDVFHHTMEVVENSPKDLAIRWAALFHDSGKPACKTTSNYDHFYGHPDLSGKLFLEFAEKMKFSNELKDEAYTLIVNHDALAETPRAVRRALSRMGKDSFLKLVKLQKADIMAHTGVSDILARCANSLDICRDICEKEEAFSLKDLAVNGHDLLEIGYAPDKMLGDALQALLEAVLNDSEKNDKETLLEMAKAMKEEK